MQVSIDVHRMIKGGNRVVVAVAVIISSAVALLFIVAAVSWPGALWTYIVFTTAFLAMLAVGLIKRVSFGFIFLTITLWIGYWLKLTIHTIDSTITWAEPTGFFDFSPHSYDRIALLSSIGAAAVLFAGLFWRRSVEKNQLLILLTVSKYARFSAWVVSLIIVAVTVLVNEYLDINHAGIASPVLGVPWPLQGMFNWFIGATSVILLVPIYLEVVSGKPWLIPTVIVLTAGAAIAISTGSRGTLAFQSAWIIMVAIAYHPKFRWLNWWRIVQIAGLCIAMVAVVGAGAHMRREQLFLEAIQSVEAKPRSLWYVARLPVDRWIGLEGLMAVSAYPSKSSDLLLRAVSEKRVKGRADMFTAEISNSGTTDTTKIAYATLPGMFAYWYYSNSTLLMFGMVFLLVTLVIAIERLVDRITGNPFFVVSVGLTSAIAINMSPGGLLIPAAMLALNISLVVVLGLLLRLLTNSKLI
jgi:hypothetical protein